MTQKSGFFVLDKPAGISSARAISQLQRNLSINKIGHAGTLDPFATGVLVTLVNRATKLASFIGDGEKCYRAIFRFGICTDSDDRTGRILEVSSQLPSRQQVDQALLGFVGDILQRPPRVSAVKIDGKRAYKRARAKEDFETKEKLVSISKIEVHDFRGADLELSIWCGSGTYIRSIARDLGKALGSCATVIALRREKSAPFSVQQALTPESARFEQIIGWDSIFPRLPRVLISDQEAQGLERGDQRVVADVAKTRLPGGANKGERYIFQLSRNNASLGLFEFDGQAWTLWAYMGE